jgi:hypothetical protein
MGPGFELSPTLPSACEVSALSIVSPPRLGSILNKGSLQTLLKNSPNTGCGSLVVDHLVHNPACVMASSKIDSDIPCLTGYSNRIKLEVATDVGMTSTVKSLFLSRLFMICLYRHE